MLLAGGQGATENARPENAGRSKMQGWKMRDHQVWKAIWRLSVQTVS